ncbi:hypothetical protein E3J79_04300 [Candidatus Dependentiae bacterium]|nr:MAG: hypothetical protein E3J79_04300 [Candidatus Dependentiae bacterium]
MNKKLLSITVLGTCMIANESFAVKMWVENQTYSNIKAEFGAKTKRWSTKKPFIIPPKEAKSKDLVFGASLDWFAINDQKVDNINKNGTYWYLIVKPTEMGKEFIYELYRVKAAYAAKMTASIVFSPITGYLSLIGLPKAKRNLKFFKEGRIPVGS